MSNEAPALELDLISKRFGTNQALSNANFHVRPGTVHALLGENGAGKTTLMRIAYGMATPDRGTVRVNGATVRFRSPADALSHGVGMVHQHFTLVPAMTVTENVMLGRRGVLDLKSAAAGVERLAEATGLTVEPTARVADLSVDAQQRVELLKTLSRNVKVLILDEPTAVLAPSAADELLQKLRELADSGCAIVLITHRLREALSIADAITVLRHGATTLTGLRDAIDEAQIVEAMLGQHAPRGALSPVSQIPTAPMITANDITVVDGRGSVRIRNATFAVRSGEVVGVAGVEGSGHHDLLRAIAGRLPIKSGALDLPPSVGFVPEDRQRDGLILSMTLTENCALNGAGSRRWLLDRTIFASVTRHIIQQFDVRGADDRVEAGYLSGGNQQKFILGRELLGSPHALVVDNPTRGLDVRASAYVIDRLVAACNDGVAVVAHSSDVDELLAISSRMLVVYGGSVREVPVDRDTVGRAMLGAA